MKKTILYYAVLGIFFLSACGPNYYLPTTQMVPMFEEKGEVSMNAGISADETMVVQAAYAFEDHFAIKTNYVLRAPTINQRQIEGGLAYFGKIKNGFVYEYEVGYGNTIVRQSPNSFDMDFSRVFAQPMIGFTSDYFDAGLSAKVSRIRYNVDIHDPTNLSDTDVGEYDGRVYGLIEPAFTVRAGYKFIKLQFQLIESAVLGGKQLEGEFEDMSFLLVFNYPIGNKK